MAEQNPFRGQALRIEETSRAKVIGHLGAVLAKNQELLALDLVDFERLRKVLEATAAAGNECCTGG